MLQDRYGNALTTSSSAARDAYVIGVDRLLGADAKIEDAFREAIAADEGFALAHIALARASQVLGHGAEVKAPLERALALAAGTSEREQSHIAIFAKILTGQGMAAIPLVLEHTRIWPRDAMVLAPITSVFGLIAFSGKAGREAEQLAVLQPLASAYATTGGSGRCSPSPRSSSRTSRTASATSRRHCAAIRAMGTQPTSAVISTMSLASERRACSF